MLLFLQSGGILYFYKIEQHIQQQRMKRTIALENTESEQFTLSGAEFQKCRTADNEISIDGRLYDLKSWSYEGNKVIVIAIRDSVEEGILSNAKNAMKACDLGGNRVLEKLTTFLSLDFVSPSSVEFKADLYPLLNIISQFKSLIHSGVFDILTPPPQVS
jgi:hypothetical protein